ncbi:hypothetical protein [Streptomyces gulbargensis]
MFTGIDGIDWASMSHAYGAADDVPALLRGLASPDAEERESALDGMYGAVHHQGDVYDCTVACVPFLFELVTTDGLPGRGEVVELLCGIHGDGRDPETMDFWSDDEEEYAAWAALLARAESEVRAGAGMLLGLLARADASSDPDAGLRRALPKALVRLHDDPEAVLAALRGRLAVEDDPAALRAVVAALGELAVRRARSAAALAAVDVLTTLVAPGGSGPGAGNAAGAGVPLAALVQLARCAPDRLPGTTAAVASEVMRRAREEDAGPDGTAWPATPETPTLLGHLRRLRASHRRTARAPWATELLTRLHEALDDRVAERFALLEDQLRSPDWGQRREAIDTAGQFLTGWRGPHEESVRLLGEQLREADPRIVRWAGAELAWLYAIGGPAADALADRVTAGPAFAPQHPWAETSYGSALRALAAQGDGRAVPGLVEVLRAGKVPEELEAWIGRMDPAAVRRLTPVLEARLTRSAAAGRLRGAGNLLRAAAAAGSARATGVAVGILRAPGKALRPVRPDALRALARLGAEAGEAIPVLRELTGSGPAHERVLAAAALWSAGGPDESAAVLRAVSGVLTGEQRGTRRYQALELTGRMGPEAAALLPELRRLVGAPEECGGWSAGSLAVALWRAGGDVAESLPVLAWAWGEHYDNRPAVAGAWAEMGAAAAPAVPLLRREIAAVRRHNNTGGTGRMRYHCADDELLLARARTVLEACGA